MEATIGARQADDRQRGVVAQLFGVAVPMACGVVRASGARRGDGFGINHWRL
jgi:hypothetical protein